MCLIFCVEKVKAISFNIFEILKFLENTLDQRFSPLTLNLRTEFIHFILQKSVANIYRRRLLLLKILKGKEDK